MGLAVSFFYYSWAKEKSTTYFQENIGERKFLIDLGKWQERNPLQARQMMTEGWKELGIYEELKSENNPEVINQKVMSRIEELTADEKVKYDKKSIELYREHAPIFWKSFEEKFPWYLRYSRIILFFIILASSGIGFFVGYLLEPEERKNTYNY